MAQYGFNFKGLWNDMTRNVAGGLLGAWALPSLVAVSDCFDIGSGRDALLNICAFGLESYFFGALLQSALRRDIGEIQIIPQPTAEYGHCHQKINSGNDAVILVADNARTFQREAALLERQISRQHSFLGYPIHQVRKVHLAKSHDLESAIKDPEVSSIALMGHASKGAWEAYDQPVYHQWVADWVKEAGHCKNGFGIKTGCNVIIDEDIIDTHQVLAPAFGHCSHPGGLYIVEGKATARQQYLPGSRYSFGLSKYPTLIHCTPIRKSPHNENRLLLH